MEELLQTFEEYGAQLQEVEEALRVDPTNVALQELLTEIATGIEETEAKLAVFQDSGASAQQTSPSRAHGEKRASDNSEAELELSEEDENDGIHSSSDDDDDNDDEEEEEEESNIIALEEPHYTTTSIAMLAQGWLRQENKADNEMDAEDFTRGGVLVVPPSAVASGSFGEWERHTRGIGSRLLSRMGYHPGSSLGARGDGLVAPLGAGRGPRGTQGLGFEQRKKRRRRGGRKARAKAAAARRRRTDTSTAAPQTTFDFLNKRLNRDASATVSVGTAAEAADASQLRKRMFAEQEKKLALDRKAASLQASLERNKKNVTLSAAIRSMLADVTAQAAHATERQAAASARLRDEEQKKKGFKF